MKRWFPPYLALGLLTWSSGCDRGKAPPATKGEPGGPSTARTEVAPTPAPAAPFSLPEVDIDVLPMKLQMKIGAARQLVKRSPDDPQKVAELGALYYAHHLLPAAIQCFERARELEPTNFVQWYLLARAYERAGQTQQAIATYEKALAVQADSARQHPDQQQEPYRPAQLRLATLLTDTDPQRAADIFRRVLERRPNNPTANYGLARVAHAAGDLEVAAEHLLRVLRVEPQCGPANELLAAIRELQGRKDEAARRRQVASSGKALAPLVDPLEAATLRTGCDLDTLLAEARAAEERRDYQRALWLLLQARDVDPTDTLSRNGLGLLYLAQGKFSEAAAEFRAVLSGDPNFAVAKSNLAAALISLKELDEADRLLREVLASQPAELQALEGFCVLQAQRGAVDETLPLLQRARDAAPDDVTVQYQVGSLLLRLGKHREALEAARSAAALAPDNPIARHLVCSALQMLNDNEGARRECDEALRLDPAYLPARAVLVQITLTQKEYAAAQRLAREGLEHSPDSALLLNTMAWLLATSPSAAQRNADEAVKLAERACQLTNYADFEKVDTLAAAYAEAGRFDDARRWAAEAIRLARAAGEPEIAAAYQRREALYKQDKPFHEPE